jgi:hypothetical protein
MLEFFKYSTRAVIQRTIVDFPAFLEHGSVEKIVFCAHTKRSTFHAFLNIYLQGGSSAAGKAQHADADTGKQVIRDVISLKNRYILRYLHTDKKFFPHTYIRKFRGIGCKVIYEERLPNAYKYKYKYK